MSAVSTQSRSENIRGRSRGGYRGRGRGRGNHRRNDGQRAPQAQAAAPSPANLIVQPEVVQATRKVQEPPTSAEEDNICFICAEAVKFYSLSECNHRTCHICALRLRALYKVRVHTVSRESLLIQNIRKQNAHSARSAF